MKNFKIFVKEKTHQEDKECIFSSYNCIKKKVQKSKTCGVLAFISYAAARLVPRIRLDRLIQ